MIIPTPNLMPESVDDYAKQNEIIRRLCLGVDNSWITYDSVNRFQIAVSAGIIDVNTDETTITLLVIDAVLGAVPLGIWPNPSPSVPMYAGINYNASTSAVTAQFFTGSEISWNYNRCGYWDSASNSYRILNKRLWSNGAIEFLERGVPW